MREKNFSLKTNVRQESSEFLHSLTSNGSASDFPGTTRTFAQSSTVVFKKWASGGTAPTALPSGITWGNLTIDIETLAGSWNQTGNLTSILGNFTVLSTGGTTREFRLSGNTAYTLTIGGNLELSGGILNLTNGTGAITPPMDLYIGGSFTQTGGTFTQTATNHISLVKFVDGTSSVSLTRTAGTFTSTRMNFQVAASKELNLSSNLTVAASRTLTVRGVLKCGTSIVSGSGSFVLDAGGSLGIGSAAGITTSGESGNIQVTATRSFSSDATYIYNGSVAQQAGNGLPTTTRDIILQNPTVVTLSQAVTVSGTLALNNSVLATGAYSVTIAQQGTLTRGAGFIEGKLRRFINTGVLVTQIFEIGTGSAYTPLDIALTNVSISGMLVAQSVAGKHPSIGSAGLDLRRGVNRYWSLVSEGVSFGAYSATFNFLPADIDAGASTALFLVRRFDGTTWKNATIASRQSTSIQTASETALSDFAVGEASKPATSIVLLSGNGQTGPVGSLLPNPMRARVTNADGDPVFGQHVVIGLVSIPTNQIGAALTTSQGVTDAQGMVSTSLVLGSKAGSYVGSFIVPGLVIGQAVFTATAFPGPPASLAMISGNGQTASAGKQLAVPFVVGVTDLGGNPVQGIGVSFTIASTPAGAAGHFLSVQAAYTNDRGEAPTVLTLGNLSGTYTVRASSPGLSGSPVTFTATATTLTAVENLEAIPTEFQLLPNYPNPFNPSTRIRFGLPEQSAVRLEIYNMLGMFVGLVADDELGAGTYEATWKAENIPSGTYVVRMSARSLVTSKHFSSSRRLTLIK